MVRVRVRRKERVEKVRGKGEVVRVRRKVRRA